MSSADHEDAVARSLDFLPENDQAWTDPRFVKNRRLAEEARTAREAAIDVWLTVSPLRATPPDILGRIMEQVAPEVKPVLPARRARYVRWTLGIGGWAAAAVLLILPYFDRAGHPDPGAGKLRLFPDPAGAPPVAKTLDRPGVAPSFPRDREQAMREQITRLTKAVQRQQDTRVFPKVKSLSTPGSVAENPSDTQQRLRRMLVNALRSSLEARTGAPGDSSSLVIERGWIPPGMHPLTDGETIRHRNFPEDSWQELGLWRTEGGAYYDPANDILWQPDPEGRGFIGRRSTEADDLTGDGEVDGVAEGRPFTQSEPSGFLIENPENSSIDVIIEGVAPAPEGSSHYLVWTNPDGTTQEQIVTEEMFSPSGTLITTGTVPMGPGSVFGSMTGNTSHFELQIRSNDGTSTEIILTNP